MRVHLFVVGAAALLAFLQTDVNAMAAFGYLAGPALILFYGVSVTFGARAGCYVGCVVLLIIVTVDMLFGSFKAVAYLNAEVGALRNAAIMHGAMYVSVGLMIGSRPSAQLSLRIKALTLGAFAAIDNCGNTIRYSRTGDLRQWYVPLLCMHLPFYSAFVLAHSLGRNSQRATPGPPQPTEHSDPLSQRPRRHRRHALLLPCLQLLSIGACFIAFMFEHESPSARWLVALSVLAHGWMMAAMLLCLHKARAQRQSAHVLFTKAATWAILVHTFLYWSLLSTQERLTLKPQRVYAMSFYLSGTLVSVVTGFPPAYMAAILLVLPIAAAFTVPLEVLTGVCTLQLLSFRLGMRIEATLLESAKVLSTIQAIWEV